jgi:hypothetical protein
MSETKEQEFTTSMVEQILHDSQYVRCEGYCFCDKLSCAVRKAGREIFTECEKCKSPIMLIRGWTKQLPTKDGYYWVNYYKNSVVCGYFSVRDKSDQTIDFKNWHTPVSRFLKEYPNAMFMWADVPQPPTKEDGE